MLLLADGGISAIGGLFSALIIMFAIAVAVIVGLIFFVTWIVRATSRDTRPRRRFWLFDGLIPIGLRLVALLQFVGATLYGFAAFVSVLFVRPDAMSIQHALAFTVITAGAIVTGIGYLRGSRRFGLFGATFVAGYVLVNAAAFLVLHGWYGIDVIAPTYAVVLLLVLHLRYRAHFVPQADTCDRCGYDMRITPARCPECGTVAEAA